MTEGCTRVRVHPGTVRTTGVLLLVLALTAGLATVLGLLAGTRPAAAAEPEALASITLTSVDPSLPTRDGTITLAGRVTNTSKEPLVRPQALLLARPVPDHRRRRPRPRRSTPTPTPRSGAGSASSRARSRTSTPPTQPDLGPGKSATFTRHGPGRRPGARPHRRRLPRRRPRHCRTGCPWPSPGPGSSSPCCRRPPTAGCRAPRSSSSTPGPPAWRRGCSPTTTSPATSPPAAGCACCWTPRGRRTASYAVDPALVAELETMRAGYQVRTADGGTVAGTGQAEAARWLTDLAALRDGHDGYRLLFGSPDVAALAHAGRTDVLTGAAAAGRRVEPTEDLPLLVLPAGGAADRATLEAAAALRPRAVLLSDSATRGAGPLLQTSTRDARPHLLGRRARRRTRAGPAGRRRAHPAALAGHLLDRDHDRRRVPGPPGSTSSAPRPRPPRPARPTRRGPRRRR